MELTVEEIAAKILDILPEDKWLQGDLYDWGRMCMLGAYSKVVYDDPYKINDFSYLTDLRLLKIAEVIKAQFPDRTETEYDLGHEQATIWRFNDHSQTEYDDIRLVLEKVRAG